MSGILERFFQVALILTLMLLSANAGIFLFGELLTGESLTVQADPFGGISLVIADDSIRQSDVETTDPTQSLTTWLAVAAQLPLLLVGFQVILAHILDGIGLSLIGTFLLIIISLFQVVGISYLVWALISAFRGGGSP